MKKLRLSETSMFFFPMSGFVLTTSYEEEADVLLLEWSGLS